MARRLAIYGEPTDMPLAAFSEGLKALGISHQWRGGAHWRHESDYEPFDTVVLHGIRSETNHKIFSTFMMHGATVIVIDLGYIKRACKANREGYWYIGTGGLAQIHQVTRPLDRLEQLDVELKVIDYEKNTYGLVLGQVPGDRSHGGMPAHELLKTYESLIKGLRELGLTPIYRPHPGADWVTPLNAIIAPHFTLEKLASRCRVVTTLSSNSGLDCLIEGAPAVSLLQSHWTPLAAPWPAQGLNELQCPSAEERQEYLAQLAYAQWTPDEMKSGQPQLQLAADGLVEF